MCGDLPACWEGANPVLRREAAVAPLGTESACTHRGPSADLAEPSLYCSRPAALPRARYLLCFWGAGAPVSSTRLLPPGAAHSSQLILFQYLIQLNINFSQVSIITDRFPAVVVGPTRTVCARDAQWPALRQALVPLAVDGFWEVEKQLQLTWAFLTPGDPLLPPTGIDLRIPRSWGCPRRDLGSYVPAREEVQAGSVLPRALWGKFPLTTEGGA